MADEYILKYLQDVLDAINELEGFFVDFPGDSTCLKKTG